MSVDVAVVGLGLIGSAAVRYLTQRGLSVVGIGPPEPERPSAYGGPFASHYDSGRVTRRLDARFEWAELASRSIAEYAPLEAHSEIRFHHPVGFLFVRNDQAGIDHQRAVAQMLDLPIEMLPSERLASEYRFPTGFTVLAEPAPAGFIDPRLMLAAQLTVGRRDGATIRRTSVEELERVGGIFRLRCADGSWVEADRVLLATGPYLNDLVPRRLAARVVPEAVVLGRVAPREAARLADLPSMIFLPDQPEYEDVYVVPPTEYPDGHAYVKIGGSIVGVGSLETADEKRAWMAGSSANRELPRLRTMLETVLPRVAFEAFSAKPCLITDTAHDLPYVDQVEDGLFVAVGGNGHAAKSSDAIGALASGLVATGEWPDADLDRSAFRAVFGAFDAGTLGRHGY